jgi:predicted nucleotidyltransferase
MSDIADITLQEIIARLRKIAPAIKAECVTRLAVFGSRARDRRSSCAEQQYEG